MRNGVFILLALLWMTSCDDSPVFPNTPEIEFVSITPAEVNPLTEDELVLTIRYQDGDGDLGYEDDKVNNLWITDTRAVVAGNQFAVQAFSIPSLTPETRKPSIQGEIEVVLSAFSILPDASNEQLIYDIYIVDRAGNISNVIQSDPVTVN